MLKYLYPSKPCKSGLHLYAEVEQEALRKCCNGWVPIPVPCKYSQRLHEWAALGNAPFEPGLHGFVIVFVPEDQQEIIVGLRRRVEAWQWHLQAMKVCVDKIN